VISLYKESFKESLITCFIGILVLQAVFVSLENIFFIFLPKSDYCYDYLKKKKFNLFEICMSLIKYGSAKERV
jgi:hypothetical protein